MKLKICLLYAVIFSMVSINVSNAANKHRKKNSNAVVTTGRVNVSNVGRHKGKDLNTGIKKKKLSRRVTQDTTNEDEASYEVLNTKKKNRKKYHEKNITRKELVQMDTVEDTKEDSASSEVLNVVKENKKKNYRKKELSKDNEDDTPKEDGAPSLKISGKLGFMCSMTNPGYEYPANTTKKAEKDSAGTRIATDNAEIGLTGTGKFKNGWKYEAKLSMDAFKNSTIIDKAYVTLERDNTGSFCVGNTKGPEASMLCGGQQLLGGAAGFDGSAGSDIDLAPGVIKPMNVIGYSGKSTKAIYVTPKMGGFQLGISYTPDTRHNGKAERCNMPTSVTSGNDKGVLWDGPYGEHNIGLGLTKEFKINRDLSTEIAFIYVHENTKDLKTKMYSDKATERKYYGSKDSNKTTDEYIKLNNVNVFQTTAMITYKDFSIAGGYLFNGKSRMPTKEAYKTIFKDSEGKSGSEVLSIGPCISDIDGDAGEAWNIGAKYKISQRMSLSTVYHNMRRKITKNERTTGHMLSLALDYVICSGLKFFAEIDQLNADSTKTAYDIATSEILSTKAGVMKQRSTIFIVGARISF